MSSLNIIVIDDELAIRQTLAATVAKAGYFVEQAGSVAEATAKMGDGTYDVALCDIQMPDGNGIDLVKATRAAGIETAFIMITAFASVETAVSAMHAGAVDYIIKPVRNPELLNRLANLDQLRRLSEENRALRRAMQDSAPRMFQFRSETMLEVERLVGRVAMAETTVLITGESGTGKGVVARAIHEKSLRRAGPFMLVNCSAIPETLVESEFFGHTKGAFTGAERARKGLFLEASQGTLFLDEIGDLPLAMQAKLLNVIEEKQVRALGSEHARQVNTRIIAATNRNLDERVREARFRQDLYFRLSTYEIRIPPLRERREDLRDLIRFLLSRRRPDSSDTQGAYCIDPEAEDMLLAYHWPGNVRELENTLARACLLAEEQCVRIADLPEKIVNAPALSIGENGTTYGRGSLREQIRRVEAEVIQTAIDGAGGDRRKAAKMLGVGLSTLYRKIEELGSLGVMVRWKPERAYAEREQTGGRHERR